MTRSLLDTADLHAVRTAGGRGRFGTVVACLVDGGVVQQDPDEPDWPDRDRLVVGAPAGLEAVAGAFRRSHAHPDRGWTDGGSAGPALALAYGAAVASMLDGSIFRVYALVDDAVLDDGRGWEVLRSAGHASVGVLTAVAVVTPAGGSVLAGLLAAAGWSTAWADAHDPIQVLGALDQSRARDGRSTGVLAVAG